MGLALEDWLRVAVEGMRRRVLSQVYILPSAAQRPIRTTETFAGKIHQKAVDRVTEKPPVGRIAGFGLLSGLSSPAFAICSPDSLSDRHGNLFGEYEKFWIYPLF